MEDVPKAGNDFDLLLPLPESFPVDVHLLQVLSDVHNLLPRACLVLSVLGCFKLFYRFSHLQLEFVAFDDFLKCPNCKENLREKGNPVRVEPAIEDVDAASVSPLLGRSCGVEQFQEEGDAIDDTQDGDEVEERHVVDEVDAALDHILVECLD